MKTNNQIKELHFGLENCEGIIIPYDCFKGLSINNSTDISSLKNDDVIRYMECDITDNGKMEYSMTHEGNDIYPLTRLSEYEDMTSVDIIYEDDTEIKLRVQWYDEDNPYCNRNHNSNQVTNKLNYNAIHIEIEPFIQKYTIQEVFEFDINTIVENENKDCFVIAEDKYGKFLEGQRLSEKLINSMYKIA